MITQRLLWPCCALAVALQLGCAKQAPPPGGPEDRVSPELASVEPVSGTTSVDVTREIKLQFSKSMNRREVEGALHIFPPLPNPPDLDWDGSLLSIRPDTAWESDQTYIITVHGDAEDHRGNRLRQTFQSAFSTGLVIDSGMLVGQIWRQQRPASGILALCYRLDGEEVDPESDTADYVVQVDLDGFFQFEFLGPGTYRVFGLDDRDRDWLWNVGVEELAVPSSDVELDSQGTVEQILPLHLAQMDTVRPVITACEAISPDVLLLEFDQLMDSVELQNMHVELVAPNIRIPATRLYALDSSVQSFYARFDSVASDSTYDAAWRRESPTEAVDTCRMQWVPAQTGRALESPRLFPDSSAVWTHRPRSIYLQFASPLARVEPDSFRLQVDTDFVSPPVVMPAPFLIRVDLGDGVAGAESGSLVIEPGAIVSAQGAIWPDSQSVQIPIRLPQTDSSGGFELYADTTLPRTSDLHIRLVPTFRPDGARLLALPGTEPLTGTLLQGEYTMSLLWDRNGDGHWTAGWPYPFRASEPLRLLPDTLRIRARFTTEYRISSPVKNQLP